MHPLTYLVDEYYRLRAYKRPDVWKALAFAATEKAEAYELLLQREGGWVRNNPESKPAWDAEHFAEELGDLLLMTIAAGLAEGVDPVGAMLEKMERKLLSLGKIKADIFELFGGQDSQPVAGDGSQVR